MPRQYKPDPQSKRHLSYKKEDIENALEDKRLNNMSYRVAAAKYNIDHTVLYRYATRTHVRKMGGQTVLGPEVEDMIIENINLCSEWGYPMDQYDLRLLVKMFLVRKGVNCKRFKNNMPGVDFASGFLKRHKSKISERYAQNFKRARANVTPEVINNYFDELERTLKDVPATNIINYDESNLTDDPGRKKVLVKRGSKYPERAMNTTKCSISLMMAGTADGFLFPPYVIYKAQHLYDLWKTGGPKGTRYNRTLSGWIDIITFEDWIQTIIIPYAKKTEGKIYLIGDNLSCHLSVDAIKICKENNINLVFLPPNTTHLTQPLDVAFFRPLKMAWRDILLLWKKKGGHKEKSLPKSIFPRLLSNLFDKIGPNAATNLKSGFRKSGISPLNRQEVLSRLPDYNTHTEGDASIVSESVIELLKSMRYNEEEQPVKKKKKLDIAPGRSVEEETINSENKENKNAIKLKKIKEEKNQAQNKRSKGKDKQKKEKEIDCSKNETENEFNSFSVSVKLKSTKRDFYLDPKPGVSNVLMCRVCHSVKDRGTAWIKCIVCKKSICGDCSGDCCAIDFICLRCLQVDSDDSAQDEDYNPVKSGYSAYDEESLSSD